MFETSDFRGAAIESAILFETWLKWRVRVGLREAGASAAETEAAMRDERGRPRSADFIAKELAKRATGIDFSATSEYKAWRKDVADVRNDLVHGTRVDVSEAEALASIQTVQRCVALLRKTPVAISNGP